MQDSKKRFSDRVENYVKYRPHYPPGLLDVLKNEIGFSDRMTVGDIGSGTGISSELFVQNGNLVYGVEPNREMRMAAERIYADCSNFISINGSAEQTGLEDRSVDLLCSGQALHWFTLDRAAAEFSRVLKDDGWLAVFWNERDTGADLFQREYDAFLRQYCPEYGRVTQKNLGPVDFVTIFMSNRYKKYSLPNFQLFDFEGLRGRLQSSSYSPSYDSPLYPEMIRALEKLFDRHQEGSRIRFIYETEIYIGRQEK
ncbi:MAG: class I SAM-dependent methyltransferase [Spirochaetales bacterium]|nr:class I SAM-dependent methyltransferase [Spirochaetales bacterium]